MAWCPRFQHIPHFHFKPFHPTCNQYPIWNINLNLDQHLRTLTLAQMVHTSIARGLADTPKERNLRLAKSRIPTARRALTAHSANQ
eukprot:scaffold199168_cov32-Tisochrysis_lutea.AAC.5